VKIETAIVGHEYKLRERFGMKEQVEITFVAGHSHGWAVRYVTHRMRLRADESILRAIYVIVALGTNQQAAATGDRKRRASA